VDNPTTFFVKVRQYLQLFSNLYSISPTPDSEPDAIVYELYSSTRNLNESPEIAEIKIDDRKIHFPSLVGDSDSIDLINED
jgi:hypothetical protein